MVHLARNVTRKSAALLTALLLVLFWVPGLSMSTAYAATAVPKLVGGFEIDGDFVETNMPTTPGDDWNNISVVATSDPTGTLDTTNFTGSKECSPQGDCSSDNFAGATGTAPNKADISNVYVATRLRPKASNPATNDVWGYFGLTRVDNSGSVFYDIELNQAANHDTTGKYPISVPTRTDGDVLIILFQNGNGDFSFSGSVQKWVDANDSKSCETGLVKPCWGIPTSLSSLGSDDFYGRSNATTIAGYDGAGSLASDLFGEVGINLSAAGAIAGCPSGGFVVANVRSKASPGSPTASDGDVTGTAEIKDFVAANVDIPSACAQLHIRKYAGAGETDGDLLGGATFKIEPNPSTGAAGSFVYVKDGAGADAANNRIADADGTANGKIDITNAKPGYVYTVTETTPPAGYLPPSPDYVTSPSAVGELSGYTFKFHDYLGSIAFEKTDAVDGTHVGYATFHVVGTSGGALTRGYDAYVTDNKTASLDSNEVADTDNRIGYIGVGNMYTGSYSVTETAPPAGYTLPAAGDGSRTLHVEVNAAHSTGSWTDGDNVFSDPRAKVTLTIRKTDTGTPATLLAGAQFSLYRLVGATPDTTADTLIGSCTTGDGSDADHPLGECSLKAIWGYSYYWVETAAPAGYNLPEPDRTDVFAVTADDIDNGITKTMTDGTTSISTTATNATVGGTIKDTATVTGLRSDSTGNVTFTVYGPFALSATIGKNSCVDPSTGVTGNLLDTFSVAVVPGTSSYSSDTDHAFSPTRAGKYAWVASYSGDSKTAAAAGACGDTGETSTVAKKQPTLTTVAADTHTVDGSISDTAHLAGYYGSVTGETVHFAVYTNSSCTGSPYATSDGTLDASGNASSGAIAVDGTHSTYYWTASFDEDTNNLSASESCGTDANHEISHAPLIPTPTKSPASGTVSVYAPDNTITYTVTVQNTGTATATGVKVDDPIDSHATFVAASHSCSGSVSGCSFSQPGGVPTWTFDLAAGGTVTIQFTVTVKADDVDGQHIYNTATVHSGGWSDDTNQTDHVVARPSLGLAKNSSPLPVEDDATGGAVAPGQTITYTLPLTNSGSAAANGVVVTDQVPAHTTYDAGHAAHCENPSTHATIACTAGHSGASPDVVTWQVDVPANSTVDLVFSVVVADKADVANGAEIWNQGHFTWTYSAQSGGPNLTGDSRQIHHVVKYAVISAHKSATPTPMDANGNGGVVHPGGTIHYVVTVHNDGLADATDVTVTDAIPAGSTYTAGTASPTATFSAGVLSWTIDVPAGQDVAVSFDVTVDAADGDGYLIDNTATVDGVDTNTTTHIVTIPIVSVQKSSNPASGTAAAPTLVGPNTPITYTLTVTNAGRQAATGFVVSDEVPAGTTYDDDASCNGAANCSVAVNTVGGVTTITWTLDVPGATVDGETVTPATRTLTFSVTTLQVQAQLIDNTASYPNTNTPGCDARAETCDTNTTHHEVVFPVVTAHKTSDPASGTATSPTPVTPGQVITYTVTADNSGEADATGVTVTDTVPAGTTYVAGTAEASGGTYDVTTNTVSWTFDVPKKSSAILTFQARVLDAATNGTLIDNTASYTNMHTPGCETSTCTTETTHHAVEFAVLAMAKTSSPASGSLVQRGDRIDYTVTLTNTGLAPATGVTVTDTLPDHVTLVDGSAQPAFGSVTGNVITWTVGVPAAVGGTPGTRTLTYAVTVDKDAPEGATLTNVALVDGACVGNADPAVCTTNHFVPTGDLTLVKQVDKTVAAYGDTLTYTFEAATTGALNQTAVTVTDVLPKGTTLVAGSAGCTDAGTCAASYVDATRTLTWLLGDMAAGATRHLTFQVTIDTPDFDPTVGLPAASFVNSGLVASTETPSTPSNEVVTKVVAVLGEKQVKPTRKPQVLPFTGAPTQELLAVALLMIGAGIVLTRVRRREQ